MRDSRASAVNAGFWCTNAAIEQTTTQLTNLAQGHAKNCQIIRGIQDINTTILQEVNCITNELNAVVADIAALRLKNNPRGGERGNGGRNTGGRGVGYQGRRRGVR